MRPSLATPCKNCGHPCNVHVVDPGRNEAVGQHCLTCSCSTFEPDACYWGHTEYCEHQDSPLMKDPTRTTYPCPATHAPTGLRCEKRPVVGSAHADFHRNGDLCWNDAMSGPPVPQADMGSIAKPKRITKDSGARAEFESGMVRDTDHGKARFELLLPLGVPYQEQLLTRVAELMARGAEKYDSRNWEKANSEEEMERNKSSALRHLMQWATGETDEDHAAACVFNLLAHETTKWKGDRS